ncbi:hypothetical protein B0H14DRAFT_2599667 [Mycena olivaceomarginata]|nr:hypothetical protein B0H14DRAFT_2599667 [Mycena olivaceomarginata]
MPRVFAHDEGMAPAADAEAGRQGPRPRPGKNLPEGWQDYPEEKQFFFALFLAMDTNFRLKRKDVSLEEDPGLSKGRAFYRDVLKYMEHVRDNWKQEQPMSSLSPWKILRLMAFSQRSRCVAHDAVSGWTIREPINVFSHPRQRELGRRPARGRATGIARKLGSLGGATWTENVCRLLAVARSILGVQRIDLNSAPENVNKDPEQITH